MAARHTSVWLLDGMATRTLPIDFIAFGDATERTALRMLGGR